MSKNFYPTYEALKPSILLLMREKKQHFYPTYEALKPIEHADTIGLKATFLPYLWGIETTICFWQWNRKVTFLPYLWGIETSYSKNLPWQVGLFLPYLWGIETRLVCLKNKVYIWVIFTLPMRHWNDHKTGQMGVKVGNFYPTYEALKHCLSQAWRYEAFNIFTLPMRHWNL